MTSAEAIKLALEAAEPHETREYRATAAASGIGMLKLRLVRAIGAAERSQETHAGYLHIDSDIFKQQCARAWQWLADEHRKTRAETGI